MSRIGGNESGNRTEKRNGGKAEKRWEQRPVKKAEVGGTRGRGDGKYMGKHSDKYDDKYSDKYTDRHTGKYTDKDTDKHPGKDLDKMSRRNHGGKQDAAAKRGDRGPQRDDRRKDKRDERELRSGRDERGFRMGKSSENIGGLNDKRGVGKGRPERQTVDQRMTDWQSPDRRKMGRPVSDRMADKKGKPEGKGLCPVMKRCGGCQILDRDYSEQLKQKQKQVEELFKGICPVKPIIGMKDPFHYRNKVHAVFAWEKGNVISGIYQENSHDVVAVEKCMIEDEKADEIIGTIRNMLKSFKIRIYNEDTGFGLLRHVLIRRAFTTNEIMVVLVTASPVFPSKNNFVKALREKHPEITTIVQNINGRGTSMVLGNKEHVLYGKGYIVDELCGCRFRISSRSFYQVNPVQTEVLYGKALELAGLTGKELVVDAYCGIGTIGIIASKQAGQVIGVELNQDAVRDAVSNAKMNDRKNVRFYCNDAGRFLVNMAEREEKVDVVIMDPPRSGSTGEFLDSVGKMGAGKVVYVSCNPETLARDVRYMRKLGYVAGEVWPVDMFPGTNHVESVIMMRNCGLKGK
ncbi:23S rRNA (uracil-C(5))-methyltransferase RlmCD [uncultured Clostridium sp.]|nr:23S rRNA (uracil-C(5))-methyltransferase RlmCD [uncultured Clostridium sp.]